MDSLSLGGGGGYLSYREIDSFRSHLCSADPHSRFILRHIQTHLLPFKSLVAANAIAFPRGTTLEEERPGRVIGDIKKPAPWASKVRPASGPVEV